MLALASIRNIAGIAIIVAVFAAGWWINGARWESRHNATLADIAERTAQAQAQSRAEEQRRQYSIEGIRRNAQNEIALARTDASAADAAAQRLRERLEKFARSAASYSGVTPRGEAARDPIVLLADVLTEMERAGRELAAEADRRGVAGTACERAYDALQDNSASATDPAR